MRYSDIVGKLEEAPIDNFELVGDWNKNSSFRHEQDRKLLSNPKAQQKIIHKWSNTTVPFNFYFINSPEANRHTEVGEVSLAWLEENMPKTLPSIKIRDDAVNVLFTNNKGAERVPMTSWIIAHRLGHALSRWTTKSMVMRRQVPEFTEAKNRLIQTTRIVAMAYGFEKAPGSENDMLRAAYQRDDNMEKVFRDIYNAIGTMRSARENSLRNSDEFVHELLAQYITTGRIKFNPIPSELATGRAYWGRKSTIALRNQDDGAANRIDSYLDELATDLEIMFQSMLENCIGRTFVM